MSQSNISIILVDTQLPENIGLSSRTMFNFGIEDLRLVSPKLQWPSEKAHAVAVDSSSIVDNALVFQNLKEALSDIDYSVAFTARRRDMNKDIVTNEKLIEEINLKPKKQKIGIVFGGEASGLTNEHISLVSKCVTISTDDNLSSLNLSHAVTVFCYSLFRSKNKNSNIFINNLESEVKNSELLNFFSHLEIELEDRGFFEPKEKMEKMKQNIRNLFHRANLSGREVQTLRGIITALTKYEKSGKI